MKVAITGKGGVGKTTVAASLAHCWRDMGYRVIAVDADPDANLAGTLGYRGPDITPLSGLKELIEERVGGGQGWGGFLKMNPRVDDIPDRFGIDVDGIRILVMGTIDRGRKGCACPENVLLREVLNHLILSQHERVIVDMEAGIEHLGRGTAEGVDAMLVVVEPGWASLQTAKRTASLATDLGIKRIDAIGNKVTGDDALAFIRSHLGAISLLGALPFDAGVEEDARSGRIGVDRAFYREMARIADALKEPEHRDTSKNLV